MSQDKNEQDTLEKKNEDNSEVAIKNNHRTSAYIPIMLVAAVLGFMLSVQFRAASGAANDISIDRAQELVLELRNINKEKDTLTKETDDLTNKLNQLKEGQTVSVKAMESELSKVQMMAGLITVTGPGIELVLDKPDEDDTDENSLGLDLMMTIQDYYLVEAVNELWGIGAEAISINGQRIVATTEIRQAGSFININLNRVVPPYQILAIGDSKEMMDALTISGGSQEYWRDLGIKVSIKPHNDLTLPAYSKI